VRPSGTTATRIALILTVRNEVAGIAKLLRSIDQQTLLPDEVVICDAGSTDGTLEAIERWKSTTPVPATVLVKPGANIAAGRNAAIGATNATFIAVTDGGCVISPRWLQEITRPLLNGAADVVYGGTNAHGISAVGRAFAEYYDWRIRSRSTNTEHSSRSVAFSRAAWERVGGYPEELELAGEDTLFFAHLDQTVDTIIRRDAAAEWTHGAESLRQIFRMHRRNAQGAGEARMWPGRHLVLTMLYAAGASLILVAARKGSLTRMVAGGCVCITMGRDTPGVALASRRPRALLIPLITVSRDFGTLVGYVAGLMRER